VATGADEKSVVRSVVCAAASPMTIASRSGMTRASLPTPEPAVSRLKRVALALVAVFVAVAAGLGAGTARPK
jgi:hypothetical protein